jgi:hypothetical protein
MNIVSKSSCNLKTAPLLNCSLIHKKKLMAGIPKLERPLPAVAGGID